VRADVQLICSELGVICDERFIALMKKNKIIESKNFRGINVAVLQDNIIKDLWLVL
jgi:hypothetical protein